MFWIELAGPSGVGKSYWHKMLVQKYPELDWKDFLVKESLRFFSDLDDFNHKIQGYSWLLIHGVFSSYINTRLYNYSFSELIKHVSQSQIYSDYRYKNLIRIFFEGLEKSELDPQIKINLAEFYSKRLKEFCCCHFLAKNDQVLLFEDGVIHNNRGIGLESFLEIETLLPNKIIYLKANLEYIYENRKRRTSNQKETFMERDLSENELYSITEDSFYMYERKILNLKSKGVDVVEVNVAENKNVLSDIYVTITKNQQQ